MTTHSQPHSTFLMVNGLRLHYFDWGNAGAPPVVCVHGYTSVPRHSTRWLDISRTASTSSSLMSEAMGRVRGLPQGPTSSAIKSVTWKG
jgi:hypothetical protein